MPFEVDVHGQIEEAFAEAISLAVEQQPRLLALANAGNEQAFAALRHGALGVAHLVAANRSFSGAGTKRAG